VLRERIRRAIDGYSDLNGMRDSFRTDIVHQDERGSLLGDLDARRRRARVARQAALADRSMLEMAISRMRENGIRVILARSREEALQSVLGEIGDERLIVKSKSNITKEIGLTPFLEDNGIRVIETDAGDRIVQLARTKPVHPTGPAANFTRYEVAELLGRHLGRRVDPDPDSLLEVIRTEIASYIQRASIGITGVNFITAEEGCMVIVHNEGNVTLCSRRPRKHIAVSAVEKVVPNLEEAMSLVKLQTFYATGSISSSYVDVISAPSRTADIEKKLFYGVHPPEEVVLVLLDAGREVVDKEMLYCVNCGGCLLQCPVYDVLGREFGGPTYLGGRGLCITGELEGMEVAVEGGLALCTNCGVCTERCPVMIDTARLIRESRARAFEQRLLPNPRHEEMLSNIADHGHPWPGGAEARTAWAEGTELPDDGETLYFAGCFPSLRSEEVLRAAVELLRTGGESVAYDRGERCCGSPVLKIGDKELFRRLAEENLLRWRKRGVKRIVTSCAGCYNMISSYPDHLPDFDIEVEHITEVVRRLIEEERIAFNHREMRVTYHDPCDLGRHGGIFEAPREILKAIPGIELVEMEMNRRMAECCGGGGGVRKGYPELASFIAGRRIESALETGASVLVTACPFCEDNFREALGSKPDHIAVEDVIILARDALRRGSE